MYHILFIHSSADGHLGYFHPLAVVNNAAMNIDVQASIWAPGLIFLSYTLERNCQVIGNSMFNFLRDCQTVFFFHT